ncbi:AGAP004136-PA-like protein [Anopheles sinensis]|uniref:AGAP004136-PA-like protein n=1 Tax=Anopheles sinensis TaxID=74873 RepID=A0A084VLA9_ANOSI|nr:AGAP004136-PA-like protein [Anopheles sinensis]
MLRFLSRRKGRSAAADSVDSQIKSQRIPTNKNMIPCRVILLDNTDLSVDLTVSGQQEGSQAAADRMFLFLFLYLPSFARGRVQMFDYYPPGGHFRPHPPRFGSPGRDR